TAGTAPPEKGDQLPSGRRNTTPSVPQAHTRRSRGERSHARVVWRADPGSCHSNPRGRTSDTNAGEPTTCPTGSAAYAHRLRGVPEGGDACSGFAARRAGRLVSGVAGGYPK